MSHASYLPRRVIDLAVSAPGLPEGTLGWTVESIRCACDALSGTTVAIIDLEVYDRLVWGFAPAHESWTCRRLPVEPALEFAVRSRREAQEWTAAFPRHDVLFVVGFSAQDTAADATGVTA